MKTVKPSRKLERTLWGSGHQVVVGVDEVGRGPLAGPVTVGAVVLPDRCRLSEVRDSKLLQPESRKELAIEIRKQALFVGIGWATHQEIDRLGLTAATRLAGERALKHLPKPYVVILDGKHNYLKDLCAVEMCVKADRSSLAVAAASVVAKAARDSYMELVHQIHPGFSFDTNKGYASKSHRSALMKFGATPFHRQSFEPVQVVG